MSSPFARFIASRSRRRLLVGLLATTALGATAPSALAATPVSLSSFPNVSSEDRIYASYTNATAPAGQIRVCLATGTGITWRKGIEWDARRRVTNWWGDTEFPFVRVASVYLEAENQTNCMTQPVSSAFNTSYETNHDSRRNGRLILGKAKVFGIYTQMYELNFDRYLAASGRTYTFRWAEDNGPQ